eukprot:TRINITY_DN669_c0_g1_i1.p1 TRINITY_DN669_c0_g1~~TRINITY_DN669_c0_g1_i1.p1  ORF type:complete len:518 (+),score=172.40 TRINITY_DN669_c0_g1_i1:38-1591(+)
MSSKLFQNVAKHPLIRINPSKVQQIWEATASFTLSKLQSQRGVKFGNLGQFNFIQHQSHVNLNNQFYYTPFFWLSRSFQSQNQITQPRYPHNSNIACVSLNFTTIASRCESDKQLVQDVINTTISVLNNMVKQGISTQLVLPGIGKLSFQCSGTRTFNFIMDPSLKALFDRDQSSSPKRKITAFPASKISSRASSRASIPPTPDVMEVETEPQPQQQSIQSQIVASKPKIHKDKLPLVSDLYDDDFMVVGQSISSRRIEQEEYEFDAMPTIEDDKDLLENTRKLAEKIAEENRLLAESRISKRKEHETYEPSYIFANRPPTPLTEPLDRQKILEEQLEQAKKLQDYEKKLKEEERLEFEKSQQQYLEAEKEERLRRLQSQQKQRRALDEQLQNPPSPIVDGFMIDPDKFVPIATDGSADDMARRRKEATRLANEAREQMKAAQINKKEKIKQNQLESQEELRIAQEELKRLKQKELDRKLKEQKDINEALSKQMVERHLRTRVEDVEEVPFPLPNNP